MKMNIPNKLTLTRIILVPVFMVFMVYDFGLSDAGKYAWPRIISASIFILAAITDFLDGKIARKNNLITTFGKLCDPLADKMLTTAALLAFMQLGLCNIWIIMIVLTREFLVTSFRLVASAQGVVIPAGIWGKLKTATQMVFSILIMFGIHFAEYLKWDFSVFALVSNILLGITALLTVISGIKYIVDGVKVIDFSA